MFNIGTEELILILLVSLLLFGAKRIPEVARALGKGMADFRDALSGMERELKGDGTPGAHATILSSALLPPPESVSREGTPLPVPPAAPGEGEAAPAAQADDGPIAPGPAANSVASAGPASAGESKLAG